MNYRGRMDINQNRPLTDSWSTPRDLPPRPSAPLNHTYPYPRPDTQPQLLNNHYLNSKYGNSGQAQALHLPQHSPPLPPYSGPQNATTQSNPAFSSQFQLYLPPQNPTQSLVVNASPYDPAQGIEHFVTLQYQPSAAGANSVKRPVLRAGQACNSCRALKTKCDEGRPHCEACQKNERVCEYTDPPVKKNDDIKTEVLNRLLRLEKGLDAIDTKITSMSTDGLTTRVVALEPVAKSPSPDADANDPPSSPLRPATARQNEVLERGEGNKNDTKSEEEEWKGEGDESGTPQQPGKPSMPINHTTSAATLLLKLPFDEVVGKIIKHDRIKKEKFPIIQEERRGLLRLWGRGEGRDPPPGYEDYPLTPSETNLEASSPAQFQNNIPAPVQRINAIGADGLPDLTRGTVDRYVWSYHTHLGILHPILTPRHLNGLIKNFLQSMPGHPSRSINTALVLLVLALGEICTHTTKIPDVSELEDQWAAGAAQRYHFPKARNLDILPGLPYFVLATTIIGNQLGGNSIPHVHAFILASLYYAQLGRVLESHTSLCHAYRALQVILRPNLDRLWDLKKRHEVIPPLYNPMVFAFWTCLQLESDILAELPCVPSGILTLEAYMPFPNLQAAQDIDGIKSEILESYLAQLVLRKHLNLLHRTIYNPEDSQYNHPSFRVAQAHEQILAQIDTLAPNFKWSEDDLPTEDILRARLQAKFYGAEVITYRSFLLRILQHSATPNAGMEIEPEVVDYAAKCIRALVKSTSAFHGLGDPGSKRLVVTNIWGTAMAQWGNMLTLQAAHGNPVLRPFVEIQVLRDLLHKTLAFLWMHSQRSSALFTAYKILLHTAQETGVLNEEQPVNRSFESQRDVTMS